MNDDVRFALTQGMADLEEPTVLSTVESCIAAHEDPLAVLAACEAGMRLVGERYERQEYFLSALIMAGEIFREVLDLTGPLLETSVSGNGSGRILVGTVRGDIHDIGKTIFQIALRAHGFTVADLGVDVAPERFLAEARSWQPDVIGLSGLLTTTCEPMRKTVRLIKDLAPAGSPGIPVVIGGGMVSEQVRSAVGADYWCGDALEGVRVCQQILADRRGSL